MEYIRIKDGKITEDFCTRDIVLDAIAVDGFDGCVGDDEKWFTADWKKRPDIELYREGLKEIPEGQKLEDDKLVEMNEVEKINAGLKELNQYEKIEDGKIVQKTMEELHKDGLMTDSDYTKYQISMYKSKLTSTDYVVLKMAEAEDPEPLKEKYKAELEFRKAWRAEINKLEAL